MNISPFDGVNSHQKGVFMFLEKMVVLHEIIKAFLVIFLDVPCEKRLAGETIRLYNVCARQ